MSFDPVSDVIEILGRHARFLGGKPALIDNGVVSYAQLWSDANAIASSLADLGLEAGDRVALACSPSSDYAELVVGILRAGLVAAPINTWSVRPEVGEYLDRLAPRAVISDDSCRAHVD